MVEKGRTAGTMLRGCWGFWGGIGEEERALRGLGWSEIGLGIRSGAERNVKVGLGHSQCRSRSNDDGVCRYRHQAVASWSLIEPA